MKAVKLEGQVRSDHTMHLRLPEEVAAGPVEVIVLLPEREGDRRALPEILERAAVRSAGSSSKQQIDERSRRERDAWDS